MLLFEGEEYLNEDVRLRSRLFCSRFTRCTSKLMRHQIPRYLAILEGHVAARATYGFEGPCR